MALCRNCPHPRSQHGSDGSCKVKVGGALSPRRGDCNCKGWQVRRPLDPKPGVGVKR